MVVLSAQLSQHKNLAMWFHSDFSLSERVHGVCKSCAVQLRDFRQVRRFLTHDVSILVATTFLSSGLDYCNSHVLKIVLLELSNTSGYTSANPVLKKSH